MHSEPNALIGWNWTHVLLLACSQMQSFHMITKIKFVLYISLSVVTYRCLLCMTCHVFRISIGDDRAVVRHAACALQHLCPSLPFYRGAASPVHTVNFLS